jgi:radical SAM enzyme (TIGR01210 family)
MIASRPAAARAPQLVAVAPQPDAVPGPAGYPGGHADRDRFVLARRGARPAREAWRHQGVLLEPERSAGGAIETTATVFLTGRECPWHCVMCDLWQYTTVADTPVGALPAQIAEAVAGLRAHADRPTVIKLYNAGSFFDRRAVPPADHDAIATELGDFTRVIVESHPALVGDHTWRFRDTLESRRPGTRLEVAIGLETAHPGALAAINKRVTVDDVVGAADALRAHDVDVRMFLLIHPPFVPPADQDDWLARSVALAFACGATAVSLIPTRPTEGAMQALAAEGRFAVPSLRDVERSLVVGRRAAGAGRLFVDTWDLERFASCAACADPRRSRLARHHLEQQVPAAISCAVCGEATPS